MKTQKTKKIIACLFYFILGAIAAFLFFRFVILKR